VGGNTQEAGTRFYVREEFANEGKQHRFLILTGTNVESVMAISRQPCLIGCTIHSYGNDSSSGCPSGWERHV
jgi:hypothetical protein